MKKSGIVLLVIVGLLVLAAVMIWGGRSALVSRSQAVDEKWSQVQNVYQRRFDLVPNLVASVDNFMMRQQETLTEVIAMRQRVIDLKASGDSALLTQNPQLLDSISTLLSRQLNSFINVVSERYPEIKGEQLYSDLLVQLEGTENRIVQERRTYNEIVRDYNTYRQTGIRALIAGAIFGFPYQRDYFAATSEAQTAPSVRDAFDPNKK
ncbi:MAG: LemA family protein [candidate division Zixibacteria bacterium]|nr:LemA family protein [candidate division Zixibacteria bacterium]